MFKNLTVAKRLILGFGAIVVLGIGIATYASSTMKQLDKSMNELVNNRLVKVRQFNRLKLNFYRTDSIARSIAINNDPAFVEEQKRAIATIRSTSNEIMQELDKTVVMPKRRELVKTIIENRTLCEAAVDRAMALAVAGDKAGAGAVLLGDTRTFQRAAIKAIDAMIDVQQEVADTTVKDSRETAQFGSMLVFGFAVLMAALGTTVGWLLTRNIRKALGAEPSELNGAVARVADGDLSQRLVVAPGDRTSVLANIARMQAKLVDVVAGVRTNSESVATASAQIAQGNHDLSARTEQQASALQQTAASMEELSSTVRQNADNAQQANQLASSASTVAVQGGEVVGQVVETMKGISEASRRIGDIIGTIDGIAFQTNILALNAAVEAARAGEQGRGFAVVASEVRSLAQRSAEAAKEIKGLIGESVTRVEQGTALVDRAGATMTEVVESIRRVTDMVAEISAASTEQSQGVAQVGEAVTQMDHATQQNAALVEESAAAAGSLKGQAEQLVDAVSFFQLSTSAQAPVGRSASFAMQAIPGAVPHAHGMPSSASRARIPAALPATVLTNGGQEIF